MLRGFNQDVSDVNIHNADSTTGRKPTGDSVSVALSNDDKAALDAIQDGSAKILNTRDTANEQASPLVNSSPVTFTADSSLDTIVRIAHGVTAGRVVHLTTTGVLPSPLTTGTHYYVVNPGTDDFQISLTSGGAAIDITDAGTGTHSYSVAAEFLGTFTRVDLYPSFQILYAAITPLASVSIQWSSDGVSQLPGLFGASAIAQRVVGGYNVAYSVQSGNSIAPYYRIKVINGASSQGAIPLFLSINWLVNTHYIGTHGFLEDGLTNLSRALLTRSVIAAFRPDGTFGNIKSSQKDALQVAVTQEQDTGNSAFITDASTSGHTPGVPFVGTFFPTRTASIQENLTVLVALDGSNNPLASLGGTFTFQYSEDGISPTISELRVIRSFSTVRSAGWLSNVGAFYRVLFEPDRALVAGEKVIISTQHSLLTGNDFKRLASQVLEEENQGLPVNMSFLKAFDAAGDSVNLRSTEANETIPNDQDTLTVKGITTGQSPDGTFVNLPASGVSSANSTTSLLGIGVTFTGAYLDMSQYAGATVSINVDVDGTLLIDHSPDGITVPGGPETLPVTGGVPFFIGIIPLNKFLRIRYTNGAIAQVTFSLVTEAKVYSINPRFQPITANLDESSVAQLVRSTLTGQTALGEFKNVAVSDEGLLLVQASDPTDPDVAPANISVSSYVQANKVFSISLTVNMASTGTDNPLLLIRNPSSSTVTLYLYRSALGVDASASPNRAASFKIFANPTITTNGTAQTPVSNNIGGGSPASVMLPGSLPTVSAPGSLLSNLAIGQNVSSVVTADDFYIHMKPNNSILLTGNPSANNTLADLTVSWVEV